VSSQFCNSTYTLEGITFNSSAFIDLVKYGSIINQKDSNTLQERIPVFIIVKNDSTLSEIYIIDYYAKTAICVFPIVYGTPSQVLVTPNGTIYYLYDKTSLRSIGLSYIQMTIGNSFTNPIRNFIWADNLSRFFIIDDSTLAVYDENQTNYFSNLTQQESDLLASHNISSFTKIAYDELHSDLYLVLGNFVYIYDIVGNRLWYRFAGNCPVMLTDIMIISSKISEKFCILTIDSFGSTINRWQPVYSTKNNSAITFTNSTDHYQTVEFSPNSINSIVSVFNGEFLIFERSFKLQT